MNDAQKDKGKLSLYIYYTTLQFLDCFLTFEKGQISYKIFENLAELRATPKMKYWAKATECICYFHLDQ